MEQQATYFTEFGEVLLFLVAGLLFIAVTLLVSRLIRPNRPNEEKLTTYESGEEPLGTAYTQFNIRFYIIALIFILFEVELVFLFPWATIFVRDELMIETAGLWGKFTFLEMLFFLIILGLGLAYAWVNGFLDWVKPDPQTKDYASPVPKKFYDQVNERYDH
jgi:NADH-quinone oxidoreductase subunit A